jgi:hypothetical protein
MGKCPVCGEELKGRSDRVYCSSKCKSSNQYEERLEKEQYYLKVDRQLKVNRKLLKRFNTAGKSTIRKELLIEAGFDPMYFTNYWKNQKGDVYLFCYEFGFIERKENDKTKYVLVHWQEYMSLNK